MPALPDPYVLGDEVWSEDMSLWPDLQYGDVYNYLIESKGQYTAKSLNKMFNFLALLDIRDFGRL